MDFTSLLLAVGNEPLFETGFLLSGDVDSFDIRKQLSRWTAAGKIIQLRRGLYSLARPYQKSIPHPFLIANRLVAGSYVSLQSALAFYGLIPESVPTTISVTTANPKTYDTLFGQFEYRHIQVNWFHAYKRVEVEVGQWAFVATPEKALLDLVYLQPGSADEDFIRSLRLQALDQFDRVLLQQLASTAQKPKFLRGIKIILQLVEEEKSGYEAL